MADRGNASPSTWSEGGVLYRLCAVAGSGRDLEQCEAQLARRPLIRTVPALFLTSRMIKADVEVAGILGKQQHEKWWLQM